MEEEATPTQETGSDYHLYHWHIFATEDTGVDVQYKVSLKLWRDTHI